MIIGDSHGTVGQDQLGIENVSGVFRIGGKNASSYNIINFLVQNNMSVMNTFVFIKKTINRLGIDKAGQIRDFNRSITHLMFANNKRLL